MKKRNTSFGLTPSVRFNRSKFDLNHRKLTTMDVGRLYPIDCQEVLPGDSFKTKVTNVTRVTSSFIKPVIDNCFMDIYHFYVPLRLVYDKCESVFGNASPSAYVDPELAEFPSFPEAQTVSGDTIADYLDLPLGNIPAGVSLAPFRAFALIYNRWFRNENTVDETYVHTGEFVASENLNNNEWSPTNYTGKCPFVGKKKDYFTSCLPAPQKGEPVNLPLGTVAPVFQAKVNDEYYKGLEFNTLSSPGAKLQLKVKPSAGNNNISESTPIVFQNFGNPIGNVTDPVYPSIRLADGQLYADLSEATASNVNDIRFAFQYQKLLERASLYGDRFNEYLLANYGVSNPDSRLQIPEFLGGSRIPINVTQVTQTSSSTEDSPLGNLSGYSLSGGESRYTKGFTEFGYVITVACVRTMHTYSQGIPKKYTRKNRTDFYNPLFANIGEQPVYRSEIFASSEEELKGNVFGYNEAWADYRYAPSTVSGQLRPTASDSLDVWHFGDKYQNAPTLTDTFTNETGEFFDRTVSVPSSSIANFICDFYFDTEAIRVLPTYSIPGLIDHH